MGREHELLTAAEWKTHKTWREEASLVLDQEPGFEELHLLQVYNPWNLVVSRAAC